MMMKVLAMVMAVGGDDDADVLTVLIIPAIMTALFAIHLCHHTINGNFITSYEPLTVHPARIRVPVRPSKV